MKDTHVKLLLQLSLIIYLVQIQYYVKYFVL